MEKHETNNEKENIMSYGTVSYKMYFKDDQPMIKESISGKTFTILEYLKQAQAMGCDDSNDRRCGELFKTWFQENYEQRKVWSKR